MTPPRPLLLALTTLAVWCCSVLAEEKNDNEGHWSEWSASGPCSVTCGSGIQEIKRHWIPAPGRTDTLVASRIFYCLNEDQPNCPKNGTWSGWSGWTECTKVCGGGTRDRKRQCEGRMHGGAGCEGKDKQREDCKREPCPALPRNFDMTLCSKEKNFTCASNKMCIPKQGRCNQEVQCHDGSDEIDCPKVMYSGIGQVRYDLRNKAKSVHGWSALLVACSTTSILTMFWRQFFAWGQ